MTKTKLLNCFYFVILPLLLGTLIYCFFRSTTPLFLAWFCSSQELINVDFSDWLPDYLWCFSLLSVMQMIWGGWKRVPIVWLIVIWFAVTITEYFQYKGWLFGTSDWKDLIAYQAAFLTHFMINGKKQKL